MRRGPRLGGCTPGAPYRAKPPNPGRPTALRRLSNRPGRGAPTLCPPHASKRDEGPGPTRDHQSVKGSFCGRAELRVLDLSGATARSASAPRPRNWGYQRVANCRYGAVEVITGHALAAAVGSAPCDRVAVQHNPRTGVDIQSYRASSRQPLCL